MNHLVRCNCFCDRIYTISSTMIFLIFYSMILFYSHEVIANRTRKKEIHFVSFRMRICYTHVNSCKRKAKKKLFLFFRMSTKARAIECFIRFRLCPITILCFLLFSFLFSFQLFGYLHRSFFLFHFIEGFHFAHVCTFFFISFELVEMLSMCTDDTRYNQLN